MDENIDVSDAAQTDMEFNTTLELATLMPMKGTTADAHLYENVKKMLQGLNIPAQKLALLVTKCQCGREE